MAMLFLPQPLQLRWVHNEARFFVGDLFRHGGGLAEKGAGKSDQACYQPIGEATPHMHMAHSEFPSWVELAAGRFPSSCSSSSKIGLKHKAEAACCHFINHPDVHQI